MNNIIISRPIEKEEKPTHKLRDLISHHSNDETAFIGQCGYGPPGELYLITYECVVLVKKPNRTWSGSNCYVYVDRFVDLKIQIQEKK